MLLANGTHAVVTVLGVLFIARSNRMRVPPDDTCVPSEWSSALADECGGGDVRESPTAIRVCLLRCSLAYVPRLEWVH
jgi:hypothetical protein